MQKGALVRKDVARSAGELISTSPEDDSEGDAKMEVSASPEEEIGWKCMMEAAFCGGAG